MRTAYLYQRIGDFVIPGCPTRFPLRRSFVWLNPRSYHAQANFLTWRGFCRIDKSDRGLATRGHLQSPFKCASSATSSCSMEF
jgi:hypothetical protein